MQYDINPEIPLVILLSGCACVSPLNPKSIETKQDDSSIALMMT